MNEKTERHRSIKNHHFRDFAPIRLTLPQIGNSKIPWTWFNHVLKINKKNPFHRHSFSRRKSAFWIANQLRSDLTSEI